MNQFLSKLLTREQPVAIYVFCKNLCILCRISEGLPLCGPMTGRRAGLGSTVNGSGTALTNLGTLKPSGNSIPSASCKHTIQQNPVPKFHGIQDQHNAPEYWLYSWAWVLLGSPTKQQFQEPFGHGSCWLAHCGHGDLSRPFRQPGMLRAKEQDHDLNSAG